MEINKTIPSSLEGGKTHRPEVSSGEPVVKPISETGKVAEKGQDLNKEQLEHVVDTLNDFIKPVRTNLKFELHERLERYYVSVIDSETDEVIKEIPPKQLLDMYAEMAALMGILVDEKV